ncbi:MAG: cytochrome b/b6 domain-containing protein [Rhodothalassiaceae bacterium]
MTAQEQAPRPQARTWTVVWDPLVRVFHWTLALSFFLAYVTEDDFLTVHVWSGYVVGGLVVLRILWGFVGPEHARFSDFLFAPARVWGYLFDLLRLRAKRYLGHSPAGGAMVIALLASLAMTVWSGLELYAIEENAGPLAGELMVARAYAADEEEADEEEENGVGVKGEDFWEETHEMLANIALALVILHISGVILASLVHRENLARAMVTGRKELR